MSAMEGMYRALMRRNSVYIAVILSGAFFGEKAVDTVIGGLWESNNKGKLFKDMVAEKQG